jgi:two-component sensor histidine kinase
MLTAREIGGDGLEIREANHRMMNLLATLLAIFRRQFSRFDDERVRSSVAQFENQILAASALLRTVSSASTAADAAVDDYLERLGRALSGAVLGPANIGCELSSDRGRLPIKVCERLGFIIVELVFNASKYAFAGRKDGVVRIEMIQTGSHWRCTVSDNGGGMEGASRGRGLNIVDALARSLRGRLIMASDAFGTRVCVVFPDQPIARDPEPDELATAYMSADPAPGRHSAQRLDDASVFAARAMY